MCAQILPPPRDLGSEIGKGAREGFNETFLPALQQQYQKSRLQSAFNKIQPGGDFLQQLKAIAPEFLTTAGGSQALSELIGPLSAFAQNQAIQDSIRRQRENQPPSVNVNQGANKNIQQPLGGASSQGTDFRNPQPPVSSTTPFPKRTAGPTPQPEMSPSQIDDLSLNIMQQSAQMGKPITYPEAQNIALQRNNVIKDSNNQIQKEKELQEAAQSRMSQGMVNRAQNSGLIKNPEDETVARKFANQAIDAGNPEEGWEYVRSQMRRFESAKQGLLRNYDLPGPITEAYRKLASGNYKDLETAGNQAQKHLDFYREHGLFDEARADLTSGVGLGPEQAESWLFPFSKEQKKDLDFFKNNPAFKEAPPIPGLQVDLKRISNIFPGEKYNLDSGNFDKFKEQIGSYLKKNPETNLISFRGSLNQGKKYSWNDISRAVNELIDEKRFKPDPVQESQMKIVDNPPLPGLFQQFQFLWSGKK